MAQLRIYPVGGPQGGSRDVPLTQGEYILGRDPGCSLPLADQAASRTHASLRNTPQGWLLEDLDSSNGTLVQGTAIRSHRLRSGDEIQIGETRLLFLVETPPPLPRPPRPKRRLLAWALGCCSLLVLALGVWLGSVLLEPQGSKALMAAAEFRLAASQDAPGAFSRVLATGLQGRRKDLDEALWPTVDADLGWSRFFATSLVVAAKPRAGHRPILFYNPWADVGLATLWTPKGRILDMQLIAGECLRRGGKAPFGGRRGWLHQEAYGPLAVAGLSAQTLKAFEQLMDTRNWSQGLESTCEAFQGGQPQAASRMACGLQFAEVIEELVAFTHPEDNSIRLEFAQILAEGPAAVDRAALTPKATAALLKALKPQDWAALRPVSFRDTGEKVLVMAQHAEHPDLFLGVVFRRSDHGYELERLDAFSFQAWYGAVK